MLFFELVNVNKKEHIWIFYQLIDLSTWHLLVIVMSMWWSPMVNVLSLGCNLMKFLTTSFNKCLFYKHYIYEMIWELFKLSIWFCNFWNFQNGLEVVFHQTLHEFYEDLTIVGPNIDLFLRVHLVINCQ
jgi:hypothetical protein